MIASMNLMGEEGSTVTIREVVLSNPLTIAIDFDKKGSNLTLYATPDQMNKLSQLFDVAGREWGLYHENNDEPKSEFKVRMEL